jgi:uncharacterized protein YbjT (DUF2867 family)
MSTRIIFVSGATGDTGGAAADTRLEKGEVVRTLVRKQDNRSERLEARGVHVMVGDLLNIDDVCRALDGAYSAYFVFPIEAGGVSATPYFAQAAIKTKIKAIVNMSQISARRDAKSNAARDHWIAAAMSGALGREVTYRPIDTCFSLGLRACGRQNKHKNLAAWIYEGLRTTEPERTLLC